MQLITNSRMKAFHQCQRLHLIRYVQGYSSNAAREEADFGTLMHVGLGGWWNAWKADRGGDALTTAVTATTEKRRGADDATMAKVHILMAAYDLRWAPTMPELEVVDVEVQFEAPLRRPETGRAGRGVKIAGKLDAIARKRSDGSLWMVEHKTSGADLSPTSNYWQRLRMEPQVSMYFAGAAALGYQLDGCIYDVIQRPEQRLLQATPVEKRKYVKGTTRLYANQREQDETLKEFQARVASAITEAPDAQYFARAEVVRLPEELERFAVDVYEVSRQMLAAGRTQRGGLAPHNFDSCFRFGRPCEFYDHCSGAAALDDESRFHKLPTVHPELETPKEEAS